MRNLFAAAAITPRLPPFSGQDGVSIRHSPEWLQPVYHFTRSSGEMNDPNGLMYLPNDSPTYPETIYHLFFQSNDPKQTPGSIWGHATSKDMVTWNRQNRTDIKGSSGGGVSLPNGTAEHPDWRGVAFASVPIFPPRHPAVGLSLWFSTDEDLETWQLYEGHAGECAGTTGTLNSSAVICPSMVPNATRAGYIGDNYVFQRGLTYYVLSGSNKCPDGQVWCGYAAKGSTAQGLLFASKDLTTWAFTGVIYEDDTAQRLDTPDLFELKGDNGELLQVLFWLTGGHTKWMVGTLAKQGSGCIIEQDYNYQGDDITVIKGIQCAADCAARCNNYTDCKSFTWVKQPSHPEYLDCFLKKDAKPNRQASACCDSGLPCDVHGEEVCTASLGNFVPTSQGVEDLGNFICQQSLTDPLGRRVQMGWITLNLPGAPFTGAQSLPRQLKLAAGGGAVGAAQILFEPLPEIFKLHSDDVAERYISGPLVVSAGGERELSAELRSSATTTRVHMRILVALPSPRLFARGSAITASVSVLGDTKISITVKGNATTPTPAPAPTPAPPAAKCLSTAYVENADTTGDGVKTVKMNVSQFGPTGAEQCRSLCCSTAGCLRYTYTDPQPGTQGKSHMCFLKAGTGGLTPNGCLRYGTDGHCWSGEVDGKLPPNLAPIRPLIVVVGGKALGNVSSYDSIPGIDNSTSATTVSALLDVFIDGAIVEVFANSGEQVIALSQAKASKDAVSLSVTTTGTEAGAGKDLSPFAAIENATFHITAWKMNHAVS